MSRTDSSNTPRRQHRRTPKQIVLAKHKGAFLRCGEEYENTPHDPNYYVVVPVKAVPGTGRIIGSGLSRPAAWKDAARKI